jgi:hypothetical protein
MSQSCTTAARRGIHRWSTEGANYSIQRSSQSGGFPSHAEGEAQIIGLQRLVPTTIRKAHKPGSLRLEIQRSSRRSCGSRLGYIRRLHRLPHALFVLRDSMRKRGCANALRSGKVMDWLPFAGNKDGARAAAGLSELDADADG